MQLIEVSRLNCSHSKPFVCSILELLRDTFNKTKEGIIDNLLDKHVSLLHVQIDRRVCMFMDIKTKMAFNVSLTLSRLQFEFNLSSGLCKRFGSRDIRKNCIFVITLTIALVFAVCLIAFKSKVVSSAL